LTLSHLKDSWLRDERVGKTLKTLFSLSVEITDRLTRIGKVIEDSIGLAAYEVDAETNVDQWHAKLEKEGYLKAANSFLDVKKEPSELVFSPEALHSDIIDTVQRYFKKANEQLSVLEQYGAPKTALFMFPEDVSKIGHLAINFNPHIHIAYPDDEFCRITLDDSLIYMHAFPSSSSADIGRGYETLILTFLSTFDDASVDVATARADKIESGYIKPW